MAPKLGDSYMAFKAKPAAPPPVAPVDLAPSQLSQGAPVSDLKHIAVFLDSTPAGERLGGQAADLALRHGAHLVGVYGIERDRARPEEAFARGHEAIANVLAVHRQADDAKVLAAGRAFGDLTQAAGVGAEFRVVWRDAFDDEELRFLHCDLMVTAHPKPHDLPAGWSADRLLAVNGGPVLLIPTAWEGSVGEHVLIAWNASRAVRRAVNDALPLIRAAKKVTVLIVDSERYAERFGKDPGADVVAHLSRHGVEAELALVPSGGGSIAGTIAAEAKARGADLTVIGVYSHSRTAEALFGGVTRTMLSDAPSPLLLSD
jgi:nucleotide-binding universal stress UspA family protein